MFFFDRLLSYSFPESGVSLVDMTAIDAKYEYEYLVKFKCMSYKKVQWLSATDIGEWIVFIFLLY